MAKRKNEQPMGHSSKENEDLRAIYDKFRREFSAADLQTYTEIEEGIPAQQVLEEMEEVYRKLTRKKKT